MLIPGFPIPGLANVVAGASSNQVIEVVPFNAPVATGLQTITASRFGGVTPKAAMVFLSQATASEVVANPYTYSHGFTDGVDQGAMSHTRVGTGTQDGVGAASVALLITDAETIIVQAQFDSFGPDEIVLDWTTVDGAAHGGYVVLFGGDALTAKVNEVENIATTPGSTVAVGFEPDLVFGIMMNPTTSGLLPGVRTDDARGAFGWVVNQGAGGQSALVHQDDRVSYSRSALITGSVGAYYNDAEFTSYAITAGSFTASGFSLTVATTSGLAMYTLSLSWGGAVNVVEKTKTLETSTGSAGITGVGFEPGFILGMALNNTSLNDGGTLPKNWAVWASDGVQDATVNYEITAASTSTSAYASHFSSSARMMRDNADSILYKSTVTSFDADGFTLDVTTAAASAYVETYLAFDLSPA